MNQLASLSYEFQEQGLTTGTTAFTVHLPTGGFYPVFADTTASEEVQRWILIDKNPYICNNKPIIRGTRITVSQIVEMYDFLEGSVEGILDAYPHLDKEQIQAALDYYYHHVMEIDEYIKLEKEID